MFSLFSKILFFSIKDTYPEITFKLMIECAIASGKSGIGKLSFVFFQQAIELFELKIPNEKERFESLRLIIGALKTINSITEEDYIKLTSKLVTLCINMVNHEYCCRLSILCCFLYSNQISTGLYESKENIVKYLKSSVKSAKTNLDEFDKEVKETVLVILLDYYVYFIKILSLDTSVSQLCSILIKMIKESFEASKTNPTSARHIHFTNTINYIKKEAKEKASLKEIEL